MTLLTILLEKWKQMWCKHVFRFLPKWYEDRHAYRECYKCGKIKKITL